MSFKIQYVFYVLGVIFLFSTVAYFSYEYLFDLSDGMKTIILVCLIIVFFVGGEIMKENGV